MGQFRGYVEANRHQAPCRRHLVVHKADGGRVIEYEVHGTPAIRRRTRYGSVAGAGFALLPFERTILVGWQRPSCPSEALDQCSARPHAASLRPRLRRRQNGRSGQRVWPA